MEADALPSHWILAPSSVPFGLDEHATRAARGGIATEDEAPTGAAVVAAATGRAPLPPGDGPRDALRGAGARPAARRTSRHGPQCFPR